ncbi:MAG: glycine/sarcosine/betaine reductase component B subunit [Candidatus Binataceae bacterium]
MRLELKTVTISRAGFGANTGISNAFLHVAQAELRSIAGADQRLGGVEIEIANPGEDCRITDVFDVFEPRFKPGGPNFPGVLEPVRRAGGGITAALDGAAVVVLNGIEDRYKATIDMRGPAAQYSPYSHTANICIRSHPAGGVDRANYYRALKEAGIRAAMYLGQAAERAMPDRTEIFELDMRGADAARDTRLPRVAYIYMVASQQRPTEINEPVLYGDNVRHLIPTILHPNEVLDGAVLAPFWNFGGDTFTAQNHPMILELYRRHRRDLAFAGVVATIAAETESARTRSAVMAASLARETLGADAVVLTKYGGGIPESAAMETFEACEDLGMKSALIIWTHGGDGRIEGSLTFMSPRADAVVNCGINEETIELPPVSRVIGSETIGPLIMEAEGDVRPASGALRLRFQFVAGAADQLGGSHRSAEEY